MNVDFEKYADGLVPAIIQDSRTQQVLMLGYMNEKALTQTQKEEKVTFFSRSKQCLWTKGESSGNFLQVDSISMDCDQDALLIRSNPAGPTCHKGTYSCFGEQSPQGFLYQLEAIINQRLDSSEGESYTSIGQRPMNYAQHKQEQANQLHYTNTPTRSVKLTPQQQLTNHQSPMTNHK